MRGKWENALSEKQKDSVREETLAVSSATEVIVDKKYNRALLLQFGSHRLTEENPRKVLVPEEKLLPEEKAESRAKKSSNESVRTRRVIMGTLPYVEITSLRLDAFMAMIVVSDILRRRKSLEEVKKGGAKGAVALLEDSIQLGCVSQDSHPRKPVLREETWDQITPSKFL